MDPVTRQILFAAETASFRGDFIGFAPALSVLRAVAAPPSPIFYITDNPLALPKITCPLFTNHVFYPNPNHEQGT